MVTQALTIQDANRFLLTLESQAQQLHAWLRAMGGDERRAVVGAQLEPDISSVRIHVSYDPDADPPYVYSYSVGPSALLRSPFGCRDDALAFIMEQVASWTL